MASIFRMTTIVSGCCCHTQTQQEMMCLHLFVCIIGTEQQAAVGVQNLMADIYTNDYTGVETRYKDCSASVRWQNFSLES